MYGQRMERIGGTIAAVEEPYELHITLSNHAEDVVLESSFCHPVGEKSTSGKREAASLVFHIHAPDVLSCWIRLSFKDFTIWTEQTLSIQTDVPFIGLQKHLGVLSVLENDADSII
jgi:hypothetical protein